jgi:hypothetical protein
MDPATKRLAIFAAVIGAGLLGLVAAWGISGRHHGGGVPVIEPPPGPIKVKPANPGGLQLPGASESILSGESDGTETVAPGPEAPAPLALKAQEQAAAEAATPPLPAAPPPPAKSAAPPPLAPPSNGPAETEAPVVPKPRIAARPAAPPPPAAFVEARPRPPMLSGGEQPPPRPPLHPLLRAAPLAVAQASVGAAHAEDMPPMQEEPAQTPPMQTPPMQTPPMQSGTMPPPAAARAPMQKPPMVSPAAQSPAPATGMATPGEGMAQTAPPAQGKRPMVQFAALGSGAEALAEWQHLTQAYPDLMADRSPNITKTERGGKTFWRIRTAGFTSIADASSFCEKLKARGGTCVPTF